MSMWNNNINIAVSAYPFTIVLSRFRLIFSISQCHQVRLGTSNLDKRQEIKQFVKQYHGKKKTYHR